jgi:MFS family permease
VIGVLSVLWAALWARVFRDRPRDFRGISSRELDVLPPVAEKAARPPVPWRRLIRALLPVVFVDFGYGWTLWVFLTWLPSFLNASFGLSLSGFALFTSLVLAAGVVGDTVGGLFSDFLVTRMRGVNAARRTSIIIGLTGSLLALLPLVLTHDLVIATVGLAVSFFFLELTNAPLWAIPMDIAPAWAGTASGIMNTGFGIAGVFSPVVFGFLVQVSGWQLPFVLSIVLLALAAVVAAIMRPTPVPVPGVTSDPAATSRV